MNDMILFGLFKLPEDGVRKVDVDIMTISVCVIRSVWILLSNVDIHRTDAGFLSDNNLRYISRTIKYYSH